MSISRSRFINSSLVTANSAARSCTRMLILLPSPRGPRPPDTRAARAPTACPAPLPRAPAGAPPPPAGGGAPPAARARSRRRRLLGRPGLLGLLGLVGRGQLVNQRRQPLGHLGRHPRARADLVP